MIKECKIHLGHLKTHRDTAKRLRATIKRDHEQQRSLQERQASIKEEMVTYALYCICIVVPRTIRDLMQRGCRLVR